LRNEVLKCIVGAASIGVHFARKTPERGLNVGTRETCVEPEGNCGRLHLNPKILAYSFRDGRFSEQGGMPRQRNATSLPPSPGFDQALNEMRSG
jgi:hypothetical protein